MTTGALSGPQGRAAPRPSEAGRRAAVGAQTAGPSVMRFPDKVIVVTGFPGDLAEDGVASMDAEREPA